MALFDWLGISPQGLLAQLLLGLINGAFYAMLSLGLAIIFGLLNVINFAHGALYMMGAYVAWLLLTRLGVGYWWALPLAPLLVGLAGVLVERFLLRRLRRLDPLYGLLLTFGLALAIEGLFVNAFGVSGDNYDVPALLAGGARLGFMYLPYYRIWVIAVSLAACFATWYVIERTRLGAYLRAAAENPRLAQAFGINVPLLLTLAFGYGVALAALAGVLAAPVQAITPVMGANTIIVVFAVVVIGGMGSIMGAVVSGLALGVIEGLTKAFYPVGSAVVIFLIMALVLLARPAGLFGKEG